MKKTMVDYMDMVPNIAADILKNEKVLTSKFVSELKDKEFTQFVLVASGSSSNIGANVRYFIQKVMKVPVRLMSPATFLNYEAEALPKGSLVVLLSQGGYSTNTIAAAEVAEKLQLPCIAFCNYPESPLVQLVKNSFFYGNTPGDYFVAKGFSLSSLALMMYFLTLATEKGLVSKKQSDDFHRQFKAAIGGYASLKDATNTFYEKHKELCQSIDRAFFVGFGPSMGPAREGRLKLLETYGASPMLFELEEFLHGPDYSVRKDTTIFMFVPENSKMKNRAVEIFTKLHSLTDRVIVITNDSKISGEYVLHADMENVSEEVAGLALVSPIQYIADRICVDLRIGTETLTVKRFTQNIDFKAPGSEGKV